MVEHDRIKLSRGWGKGVPNRDRSPATTPQGEDFSRDSFTPVKHLRTHSRQARVGYTVRRLSTSAHDSVRPVTTDLPEPTLRERLGRGFFLVRLSLLLTLLVLIGLWGYGDVRSRNARNRWDHTLSVAVVIVTT